MKIAIQSFAVGLVTDADVVAMAEAIALQLNTHVAPSWDRAQSAVRPLVPTDSVAADELGIMIFADADMAGALGYHALDPQGKPYARVFAKLVLDEGGGVLDGGTSNCSVLSVVSHEAVEAMVDPFIDFWADGPVKTADGKMFSSVALEAADPVEESNYSLTLLDGRTALVSNFILPAWFDPGSKGPYDYKNVLAAPFTCEAGGYLIVRNAPGAEQDVFGDKVPERVKLARQHPAARSSQRLAAAPVTKLP